MRSSTHAGVKSFEFCRGISSTLESARFPIHIFVVRPPRYFFHWANAGASGMYAIFEPSGEYVARPPAIGKGNSVGSPPPLNPTVNNFGDGSSEFWFDK